ncbi:hypothetical protein BaRGS_00006723 [Batillaria attramentaria]|uniref:Uncharacterized protein n=1 Tax=Batillaria attramentaria TaxID=370345 RepID=A0ABD0LR58_9CAEN
MVCREDLFTCYKDCCDSVSFCNDKHERCQACLTRDTTCGTDRMPAQCRHYCHMKSEHAVDDSTTDPLANPALSIIGIVCAVLLFITFVLIICWILKRPKWLIRLMQRCFSCGAVQTFTQAVQTSLGNICVVTAEDVESPADVSLTRDSTVHSNENDVTNTCSDPSRPLLGPSPPDGRSATPEQPATINPPPDAASRTTLRGPTADAESLGVSTNVGMDEDLLSHISTQETAPCPAEGSGVAVPPPNVTTTNLVRRGTSEVDPSLSNGAPAGAPGRGAAAQFLPPTPHPTDYGTGREGIGSARGSTRQPHNLGNDTRGPAFQHDIDVSPQQPHFAAHMTVNVNNYHGGLGASATPQSPAPNEPTAVPGEGGPGSQPFHPNVNTAGSNGHPPTGGHSSGGHGNLGIHQGGCRDDRLTCVPTTPRDKGPVVYAIDSENPAANARREQGLQ